MGFVDVLIFLEIRVDNFIAKKKIGVEKKQNIFVILL